MDKYDVDIFKFSELKNNVKLPQYQRSYVWEENKKKRLIETIKKGLPIGTVLLSKKKDNQYLIIDGLQRIATLRDFERDPYKYLDESELTDEEVYAILTPSENARNTVEHFAIKPLNQLIKTTKNLLLKCIKEKPDLDIYQKATYIAQEMIDKTSHLSHEEHSKIHMLAYELLKKIENILNINEYEIPAIIFKGTDEELVEVFELLNTTGTKLSKYDVFSAEWSSILIPNVDDEVLDAVIKKYDTTSDKSGIDIDDFSETSFRQERVVSLFEYAFSIGKILGDYTKYIFKSRNNDVVDSLGFSLLAGIYNVPNKSMHELGKKFQDDNFDYMSLKKTIRTAAKNVEDILKPFISLNNRNHSAHTELQLASYIITYHRLRFKNDGSGFVQTNEHKNSLLNFQKYLPKHYLFDTLRKAWSGSGDTKLDELVIGPPDDINAMILSSRYLEDIKKNTFKSVVDGWIDEENKKQSRSISKETKLFFNALFSVKSPVDLKIAKDFDHIIPKKRFSEISVDGRKIAMSSPANITLIPSFDNRGKKEYTYYEFAAKSPGVTKWYSDEELANIYYPKKKELDFLHDSDLTLKAYNTFLDERRRILVENILKVFY